MTATAHAIIDLDVTGHVTKTPEWNDPAVYEWGTEPAHASLMPYETHAQAMHADRLDSPYRFSLDGEWKFQWSPNPGSRMLDFAGDRVDDSELGHDPRPVQLAAARVRLSHRDEHRPAVDRWPTGTTNSPIPPATTRFAPTSYNPVGQYRTTFDLPPRLGRAPHLHPVRRCGIRLLRLDQRAASRVPRRQLHVRRIRHHASPPVRDAT